MVANSLKWVMASILTIGGFAASADEYDTRPDRPRYSTSGTYTTHTPDLVVPGRFHAGPCVGGARRHTEEGAGYVPGVDAFGDPVVFADLPAHDAFHWSGPTFRYLFRRAPTPREAQLGLEPRDYVMVDPGDGTVYFNGHSLNAGRHAPPTPRPCD